jgi:hypothetical protein
MRYLLISILIFSLVSCGTLPTTNGLKSSLVDKVVENTYFSDKEIDYIYKAKIDVNNNHLGGLLIVKKIAKNHHRVVFTTEFGNKIFDFEFIDNVFKVNSIMDKLNKKIVINALKKDFQLLVKQYNSANKEFQTNNNYIYQTNLNKKDNYYFVNKKTKQLKKIVMASKHKEKVSINFKNVYDNIAYIITLKHHNFNMNIQLNYI